MKEDFTEWEPRPDDALRVEQCDGIIDEYQQMGLMLTLRQLYYQLVSRDIIPNSERSYKNLGTLVSKARMAGMLDWDAIEDRGRQPRKHAEFDDIEELIEAALHAYRLPRWKGQENYVELWVEKEALAGVLQPMSDQYHVTLMVNKGYSSQSAMYESARRITRNSSEAANVVILYLGDHDPSGEDMVRDVANRLKTFTRDEYEIEVVKLALTMAQVNQYNPPPNPTKISDSRAEAYIKKFGHECWEVDALDPRTMQRLIAKTIEGYIDMDLMDEIKEREEFDKEALRDAAKRIKDTKETD